MLNLYCVFVVFLPVFHCQCDLHFAFCYVRLSILSFRVVCYFPPGVHQFIFSFQLPSLGICFCCPLSVCWGWSPGLCPRQVLHHGAAPQPSLSLTVMCSFTSCLSLPSSLFPPFCSSLVFCLHLRASSSRVCFFSLPLLLLSPGLRLLPALSSGLLFLRLSPRLLI